MAATPITPKTVTAAGVTPQVAVAIDTVNTNSVRWNSTLEMTFHNTDASPQTVTITTPTTVAGLAVADLTINLAANEVKRVAGLDQAAFGRDIVFTASSNLVHVSAHIQG